MTRLKTVKSDQSVESFLDSIEPEKRRQDGLRLLALMTQATGMQPRMWGDSIVGFGEYRYKYASGREGNSMITGFSPRKRSLVVYIVPGFARFRRIMRGLGKFTTGKSCLYLNSLDEVDTDRLRELIVRSVQYMRNSYECK